jgi:hypothetical protein
MNNDLISTLEEIYNGLFYAMGIAELSIAGVLMVASIIGFFVGCLVAVLRWVLEAYPVGVVAKKLGYGQGYLAWIPFFGSYFRTYVLAMAVGDKPMVLFGGKYTIRSRSNSFWIYLVVALFGTGLITVFVTIFGMIPLIGPIISSVTAFLYLIPAIITGVMEYVYLKDVLDRFNPDTSHNRTAAIIVVVLDSLFTFGFARTVYLYTLLKKSPIPAYYVR